MLHLPLWQRPRHRIAEQACQPLPAFLLKPWHTVARQKRSNAHYSIFFTQFILMSAYPFPISASLSLAACACCLLSLQSDGTTVFPTAAYAHFSSHLIISSFSLLSSLLPSNLFFHIAYHWGVTASSSPSFFRTCQPQPFHILSPPLLLFNKSLSSAFFRVLFLLNAVSIYLTSSFTSCPEAMTKSAFSLSCLIHLLSTQ